MSRPADGPDPRDLAAIVERRHDEYVDALRDMVDVDCGSFTPDGVNAIADRCVARFEALGAGVERIAHEPSDGEEPLGDLLIGRIPGAGPDPFRVLMLGHMDTVFGPGTVRERPFAVDGDRARGPGVSDMKGGLLAGFFALEALREADALGASVTYLCNPDEEIGSPFSRPHIKSLAAESDAALVLEGARENGDIVSARKGVRDIRVEIHGRAAHAGVEPERGRSAVLQAAHTAIALHELNGRWPGVTVNVGVVQGGTRPNVVAERCVLEVDLRSPSAESFNEAHAEAQRVIHELHVPDVEVHIESRGWHDPMERSEGTGKLAEAARAAALELGFELRDAATGGASDANTTAAAGVPTLDGLGPVGGDDHGPGEWLDLTSVVPRVALLAALISRAEAALR
jgi:glutamate carboxypeptidase